MLPPERLGSRAPIVIPSIQHDSFCEMGNCDSTVETFDVISKFNVKDLVLMFVLNIVTHSVFSPELQALLMNQLTVKVRQEKLNNINLSDADQICLAL